MSELERDKIICDHITWWWGRNRPQSTGDMLCGMSLMCKDIDIRYEIGFLIDIAFEKVLIDAKRY